MYFNRTIDTYLTDWSNQDNHKPILLRGARQVGKSKAVRHLGEQFENFVEVNFEKFPAYRTLFQNDLDVKRIVPLIAALAGQSIVPGQTLLFLDEIQICPEAIMSLRFFKEDLPQLHVIAAGSLLEFALEELPTFGVGRIHSTFIYPMSFDEFLMASGETLLLDARRQASPLRPLPDALHQKLVAAMRIYMLIGGMPEVVGKWVETHDYVQCQAIQDSIVVSYEEDFPKYRRKVNPTLLRKALHSVAIQATKKFVYAQVSAEHKTAEIKQALEMLILAGLVIPVDGTSANGFPLGSEADGKFRKMLLLDTGLTLRILNMTLGRTSNLTQSVLTDSVADLVNRGPLAELGFGLEVLHNETPHLRGSLYYWTRQAKSAVAEIDYVLPFAGKVLPVEVKSGTQGGMKSLWSFMREKHLTNAVRCSLENFGAFDYVDAEDGGAVRHVDIYPLYAVGNLLAAR
jgi:predicted AAA+ superfamily ATPase